MRSFRAINSNLIECKFSLYAYGNTLVAATNQELTALGGKKIDLSNFTTLKWTKTNSTNVTSANMRIKIHRDGTAGSTLLTGTAGTTGTLDITSLSGECYVALVIRAQMNTAMTIRATFDVELS